MHSVICAFDDRADAERAMDRLVERGFNRDAMHLQGGYEAGTGTSAVSAPPGDDEHGFFHDIGRFFSDLFGPSERSEDAGSYAEAVRRGSTVLVVDAIDEPEAERARQVMDEMGGRIDMDERVSQWRREGWTGFDTGVTGHAGSSTIAGQTAATDLEPTGTAETATGATATTGTEQKTVMPVVQEELQVGKREVETGGVRVVKRVTETPVKEMVRLREERATVERRPVDRAATEADLSSFKEGTVEVRETSEEPVIAKTARVVEEVVVGKDVKERTETIPDTVRRTDVEVEKLQPGAASTTSTTTMPGVSPTTPGSAGTTPPGSAGTAGAAGTTGTTGTTGSTREADSGESTGDAGRVEWREGEGPVGDAGRRVDQGRSGGGQSMPRH